MSLHSSSNWPLYQTSGEERNSNPSGPDSVAPAFSVNIVIWK